jgi:hypothetical protein
MQKKAFLAVLLALAVPTVWIGSGGRDSAEDYAFGFGKQIAGGCLATLDIGAPVDVLMTLAADGNVIVSGQLRWAGPDGTGGWEGTRYNTTAHESWSRIGPNWIKLLALLQVQNNDGGVVVASPLNAPCNGIFSSYLIAASAQPGFRDTPHRHRGTGNPAQQGRWESQ